MITNRVGMTPRQVCNLKVGEWVAFDSGDRLDVGRVKKVEVQKIHDPDTMKLKRTRTFISIGANTRFGPDPDTGLCLTREEVSEVEDPEVIIPALSDDRQRVREVAMGALADIEGEERVPA